MIMNEVQGFVQLLCSLLSWRVQGADTVNPVLQHGAIFSNVSQTSQ